MSGIIYNPDLIAPEAASDPALPLWNPHSYHLEGIQFLLEHLLAQIWWSPGLGKTTLALATFLHLLRMGAVQRMLVIAPLRVAQTTWRAEAAKWRNFAHLRVNVYHGNKKDAIWEQECDIGVINYEGIEWLKEKLAGKENPFQVLVLDEVSKLKNPSTQRFKSLVTLCPRFALRWGLTGSPAPNHLLNIWGPQRCIDGGAALGTNYFSFREQYFYPPAYGDRLQWEMDTRKRYHWAPIPDNVVLERKNPYTVYYRPVTDREIPGGVKRLYEKMAGRALAMHALDHLQMPALVTNDIYIDFPSSRIADIYRQFERPWLLDLEPIEGELHAAAHGLYAQQITSGFLYEPGPNDYLTKFLENNPALRACLAQLKQGKLAARTYYKVHQEKIEVAQGIVEELCGAGALIAYQFEHELAELREAFPQAPVLSELSASQLAIVMKAWNEGEYEVLLCQPKSVGHGLNLQGHGQAIIWYSLTWSLEEYEQLNGRIWRQGQKNNTITVHRLIMNNSIDVDLVYALESKDATQNSMIANTNANASTGAFERAVNSSKAARLRAQEQAGVQMSRIKHAAQIKGEKYGGEERDYGEY